MLAPLSTNSPSRLALPTSALALLLVVLSTGSPLLADGSFVHAQRANIEGMGGALTSALSPDGRALYVAAFSDSAVVRFRRDPPTGALTFLGADFDNDAPAALASLPAKGNIYDGLLNVADLVISADGAYLYSAGWGDDAIGVLRRAPNLGLIPLGAVDDPGANRLDSVSALALSPDDSFLYAAAHAAGSVCALERNAVSGSLTLVQCLVDPDLAGARDLAVTADGGRLLLAAQDAGALVWVDLAGSPSPNLFAGHDAVSGLLGAAALALSPDGRDVYVATVIGQTVAHLHRSGSGYTLVDEHLVETGAKTGVWVSPDGSAVFVSNLNRNALHRLVRDPLDGTLADPTTFSLSSVGETLDLPAGLTGTADGRNLYVASLSGHLTGLWVDRGPAVEAVHAVGSGLPFRSLVGIAWDPTSGDLYATASPRILYLRRDARSGALTFVREALTPGGDTLVAVSPASGVVYTASPGQGRIERFTPGLGAEGTNQVALSGIAGMTITADGTQLLAVSDVDRALVVFSLHPADGSVAEVQRLDASDGLEPQLAGASGIALSPDGRRVYVASYVPVAVLEGYGGQLSVFDRRSTDGRLSFRGSHGAGPGAAFQIAQVAVSPDGRHVYASGLHGEDLYVWQETGSTLAPVAALHEGTGGVTGIASASSLTVSGDGRQVAVAAQYDGVTLFDRDPVSGALSFRRSLRPTPDLPVLVQPSSVVSSTDGRHLYVADVTGFGSLEGAAIVFDLSALFLDGFEAGDTTAWSASASSP